MRALSADELLNVWERSIALRPERRALALLAAAFPEESLSGLASLSIGRRDERLMMLRESVFGGTLVALAICPQCGQKLDLEFSIDDLRVKAPALAEPSGEIITKILDHEVRFRLPNSVDLEALADAPSADVAQAWLLKRCIISLDDPSPEVLEQVVREMEKADPQADVQLNLSCPECRHGWQSAFDILFYLWDEIDSWARRTLREVRDLARAYGWREADILAMSQYRRELYLELART